MSAAPITSGVALTLCIGQQVRHRDYQGKRVTGTVRGISIDSERAVMVDIVLDAPIVIAPIEGVDREISIWHQHVPAHELTPFDDRDEVIEEMLQALQGVLRVADRATVEFDAARAAIARALGEQQ